MGVYLCLGQPIYSMKPEDADDFTELNSFEEIQKLHKNLTFFRCHKNVVRVVNRQLGFRADGVERRSVLRPRS